MNMSEVIPAGSIPALITPFADDGTWSPQTLAELVDWHIEEGSAALVVCGTTGESAALDADEHAAIVAGAVSAASGRIPIIAGTGANDTRHALRLQRGAEAAGAAATLHATGYYNRPSRTQVVRHYSALADAATRPIIVYDIPARTGLVLDVQTVAELAAMPLVCGIKDSTGDLRRLTAERRLIKEPFAFLSGDDFSAPGYIAHGGQGCVSVTANVVPRRSAELCSAALAGEVARARELHDQLFGLHEALMAAPNPGGPKYALARMGRCREVLRAPLEPVEPPVQRAIDAAMDALQHAEVEVG